ncbi:MAG: hypothetical protein Q8P18_09195 [Pseudomonadota bacterium]|nr:hypothetical protein [Pseudomonadota bacterium]
MTATRRVLPLTPPLTTLLVALAFAPFALQNMVPSAYAGEVEKAEHIRISEEMRKLASRNAWPAVEASFKRLEELEKKGEVISYKEFMLGAESGRALGDMTSSRARVERASKVDPTKEALDWLSDVDRNFGKVEISIDAKYEGARTLVATVPPFAPDQRASITYAAAVIEGGKPYTGLLPAGEYSVGEGKVTVAIGESVATLRMGPPAAAAKEPFKLAYVGPRAQVGVAFTAGSAVSDSSLAAEPSLQAGAFSGSGARLGVGLEVGLSQNFGVIVEVGYHSLFGAPSQDLAESAQFRVADNNLHLGYGWLAGNLRFGNLWIAAGPIWSAGGGAVTGIDERCLDGDKCGQDFAVADEVAAYQRFDGNPKMGGAAASLSYALVDLGSLKGALTLEGGIETDMLRTYPWGQVAFTIAPSASRRKE